MQLLTRISMMACFIKLLMHLDQEASCSRKLHQHLTDPLTTTEAKTRATKYHRCTCNINQRMLNKQLMAEGANTADQINR